MSPWASKIAPKVEPADPDGHGLERAFQFGEQPIGFCPCDLVLDCYVRAELLKILGTRPRAQSANEVGSQVLEFGAFNFERDACSQMLQAADGCGEASAGSQRLRHNFADRHKPLARQMVKYGDMRL